MDLINTKMEEESKATQAARKQRLQDIKTLAAENDSVISDTNRPTVSDRIVHANRGELFGLLASLGSEQTGQGLRVFGSSVSVFNYIKTSVRFFPMVVG